MSDQASKYFLWSDFACRDENRTPVPDKLAITWLAFAQDLDAMLDEFGGVSRSWRNPDPVRDKRAIVVHHLGNGREAAFYSFYRTPEHNARQAGSSRNSRHVFGAAADFGLLAMSGPKLASKVEHMINRGLIEDGGLGIYRSRVHYDRRDHRARW